MPFYVLGRHFWWKYGKLKLGVNIDGLLSVEVGKGVTSKSHITQKTCSLIYNYVSCEGCSSNSQLYPIFKVFIIIYYNFSVKYHFSKFRCEQWAAKVKLKFGAVQFASAKVNSQYKNKNDKLFLFSYSMYT